uniref:Uncharacterized protein n=1 Tax=Ciona intestinalis TaxID=7719 RepID=H2XYN0_CIOIN
FCVNRLDSVTPRCPKGRRRGHRNLVQSWRRHQRFGKPRRGYCAYSSCKTIERKSGQENFRS